MSTSIKPWPSWPNDRRAPLAFKEGTGKSISEVVKSLRAPLNLAFILRPHVHSSTERITLVINRMTP